MSLSFLCESSGSTLWSLVVAGAGAIIGGCLTGCFSLLALKKQHKNNLQLRAFDREVALRRFYRAISCELETALNALEGGMWKTIANIKADEEAPMIPMEASSSPLCPIYHALADMVGEIEDIHLANHIITTYDSLGSLLDEVRDYSKLCTRFEEFCTSPEAEGVPRGAWLKLYRERLRDFSLSLNKQLSELKGEIALLIKELGEQITN